MTGARRSSAQTSRLNSMINRIGEVATTEAVRKPPIATSGGADRSGGEISTAISPTTSPAPIVPTVSPLMTTSAVPLSMAYSEYPMRPSAASTCPGGISASDAMLATAASSSSGKSAKKRIAASRNVSIFPRLHRGFSRPRSKAASQGGVIFARCLGAHDLANLLQWSRDRACSEVGHRWPRSRRAWSRYRPSRSGRNSASGRDVPPVRAGVRPESLAGAAKARPARSRAHQGHDGIAARRSEAPPGSVIRVGVRSGSRGPRRSGCRVA